MNPAHKPWQRWEVDFVAEKYPDRTWDIHEIAKTLKRPAPHIYNMASRLGVKRPGPKLDHARIVELRAEGLSLTGIATVLGCSKGGVQRALKLAGGSHES